MPSLPAVPLPPSPAPLPSRVQNGPLTPPSPSPPTLGAAATIAALLRQYPIAAGAAFGLLCGVILLALSPEASRLVFAATAIGGGAPLVFQTLRDMARGRFQVDTIAALAIIGAVGIGEFLAGALVVLMQSGGEALEDYGMRRANASLDNLLRRAPSVAHRKEGAEFAEVAASALRADDILLVRPGDIIAADGIVSEGSGSVDESALTGEPVPLAKAVGDTVFSGTINLSGSFLMRVTSAAAQSKYERIVRMVQNAQGERAPIHRLADRYTPFFTLFTITVALVTYLVRRDPTQALAVLVVATPCPLIIATPLAVLSAINRAASLNIIVKGGAAIEAAASVRCVLFDKTGTLTVGTPTLSEVRLIGEYADPQDAERRVLAEAASIEVFSAHVVASAVVKAARARGLSLYPARDVSEAPGTGVCGTVENRRYVIGSAALLRTQGICVPAALQSERAALSAQGRMAALVAVNGTLAAMLLFEDRLRPEGPALVERLRRMKIERIAMLTGDAEETAQAVAQRAGITDVRARMQPEDKMAALREMSAMGSAVMMVGDGINDAPALASASVGVAMGGYGAGIATDAADVVITVENVERVADVIGIGRRMVRVAREGILLGIGASCVFMLLASFGFITPVVGAFFQEVLDLVTILNALRARTGDLSATS